MAENDERFAKFIPVLDIVTYDKYNLCNIISKRSIVMNRMLKRILPILLVIVVICSIAWYLFVYDKEFTRDALLTSARYFDDRGNHNFAAWLYRQAYLQTDNNETVAIELAEQFKEIGNYTQAENTLANAIADGGSAELYVALCKTYVEQNKLLDAVTMLDNISNPEIKAQLDAIRPKVPEVNYAPGTYSQYITLNFTTDDGTLYTTVDEKYPSLENPPSTGEITLVSGENTIFALVVGENGLVSPLSIYGYVVIDVVEEVTVEDPTLDALVRQMLGFDSETPLYSSDLWNITELSIPDGLGSYSDLALFPYLEKLTISGCVADGMESFRKLTQLTHLTLESCIVSSSDLKIIAGLPALTELTLSDCNLSNIESLSAASKLTTLDLSSNAIRDLSALTFLSCLESLNLSHNALTSLNAISSLSSLKVLDISYNSLESVAPLTALTQLQELYASNNAIATLIGLDNIAELKILNVSFNALTEVTPIAALVQLESLDLSSNQLTDISCLSTLNQLQFFYFSRNQITALPAWEADCALVTIDGSYNNLQSIAGLGGFSKLNHVYMDYNNIKSVNALATCYNLIKVSVMGNPVKDVSALTNMDVIVNYNPL